MADTNGTSPNGNTKNIRARAWCWTWNNYKTEDMTLMKQYIDSNCQKGAFQEEKGEKGTPHLQGYFEFKNARYFDSVKKDWPKLHLEKARNKDASYDYCLKDESRVGEQYQVDKSKRTIRDPLQGKTLRPWQQEIINLCSQAPDDRTIHWYYDEKGGSGKTSLAKHLCLTRPNEVLYICGKANDIKYGIKSFLDNTANNLTIAIFDFTRSTENFVSYEAIEAVKNGIFYNSKYESGMVVYDPPHIICFSNFHPEEGKLSADRWHITNIGPPAAAAHLE